MYRVDRRVLWLVAVSWRGWCCPGSASAAGEGRPRGQADTEVVALDRDLVRLEHVQSARQRGAGGGLHARPARAARVRGRDHPDADARQGAPDRAAPQRGPGRQAGPAVRARRHRRRGARPLERRPVRRRGPRRLPLRPRLVRRQGRHRRVRRGGDAARARHVPLKRDIVLVFEADEEGGDYGIEWLAENHWDKLDAAYSLNEGGIMSTDARRASRLAAVTVRDKISFSVVLRTRGVSIALVAAAAAERDRSARARAGPDRPPPQHARAVAAHAALLPRARARQPAARRPPICGGSPARAAAAGSSGSGGAWSGAATSARCSTRCCARPFTNTIVEGGFRSNVIPGAAEATVNMRLLPGVSGEQAVRELRRVIADPPVEIVVGSDDETRRRGVRERPRAPADRRVLDRHGSLRRARARDQAAVPAARSSRRRSTRRPPTPARGASAASPSTACGPTPPRPATSSACTASTSASRSAASTRAPTWSSGSCARSRPASRGASEGLVV